MSNIEFFAEALAYHTKGREAVLREQVDLEEKKCSCCGNDPCDCGDDCGCKSKVKESTDLKNDKNSNGIDDKDENKDKMADVKKMKEDLDEDYAMELIEHAEELYNMTMDLNAMMEEAGLSLSEAFQTFPQDLDLEEGFENMSPVKRMIAQKRAGLKKKLTTGGYKIQKKKPIGKMPAKK